MGGVPSTRISGNLERAAFVRERYAQAIEAIGHDSPLPVPAVPAEEHRPRVVPAGQEPFANDRVTRVHDVDRDVILVQQPEPDWHLPSGGSQAVQTGDSSRRSKRMPWIGLSSSLARCANAKAAAVAASRATTSTTGARRATASILGWRSPGPLVDIDWS